MVEQPTLAIFKERLRADLLPYTRRAFQMLSPFHKPRILDVGCGSGVPTLELAKLSGGDIVAVDIEQPLLDQLADRAKQAGLSDRVTTIRCSMVELDFPKESFDIIWAEGSVGFMGFDAALRAWRPLLKPEGFVVIHDDIGDLGQKMEHVAGCGYELIGHFVVSDDVWWTEYYAPLEKRLDELRAECAGEPGSLVALVEDQREIDGFKRNHTRYSSVFIIARKRRFASVGADVPT